MNLRLLAVVSSAAALVAGCSRSGPEKFKDEILAADKAFSEASLRDGIKPAFLKVVARDAKLLEDTRVGADAVNAVYAQWPTTAQLSWEPSFVDVSASGDIGYTWGRYQFKVPDPKGGVPFIQRGTYVTVWRRKLGGGWKVELDGGVPDGQK